MKLSIEPLKGGSFGMPVETGKSVIWGPPELGAFPIVLVTPLANAVLRVMQEFVDAQNGDAGVAD